MLLCSYIRDRNTKGFVTYAILILFIVFCNAETEDMVQGINQTPTKDISVLVGTKVMLPCEVETNLEGDRPLLILFYQGTLGKPIYSLDSREGPLSLGVKWVASDIYGSRVWFSLRSHNTGLVINPALPEDTGLYWCRVDYQASPTSNERFQLNVVVPSHRMFITNDKGVEVSGLIGPYGLGSSVSLTCKVEGGHPLPNITWTKHLNKQEGVLETLKIAQGKQTDTVVLKHVKREDLFAVVTCHVTNSKLVPPMTSSVTLDVSFPPLEVSLQEVEEPLREGVITKVVCQSVGSRPAANLTWWRDGVRTLTATSESFEDGNVTRSVFAFTPNISDHLAQLVCRARNPVLPTAVIEASTKLTVLYSPRVALYAGRSLNMDDIKESEDVYFECKINANPKAYAVKWFHNGQELHHRIQEGVIVSNQSLVLQRVQKTRSGDYTCTAQNMHGAGKSNSVSLSIKYVPECDISRPQSFSIDKNETIHVTCKVRSHPEPRRYRWAFNTSSELLDLSWVKGQTQKELTYTPRSDLDYGSLLCWAENVIGLQDVPCVYQVTKAALPNPVQDCIIRNVTSSSAFVMCRPGWDGGTDQFFTLRILNGSHSDLHRSPDIVNYPVPALRSAGQGHKGGGAPLSMANAAPASQPYFHLTGLKQNTVYVLSVHANNRKGQSRPTTIIVTTTADLAERRIGQDREFGYLPLAVFCCSLSLLVLLFLVLAFVIRRRNAPNIRKRRRKGKILLDFAPEKPLQPKNILPEDIQADCNGERTPDVIPSGKSTPKNEPHHPSFKPKVGAEGVQDLKFSFNESPNHKVYGVSTYLQSSPKKIDSTAASHSSSDQCHSVPLTKGDFGTRRNASASHTTENMSNVLVPTFSFSNSKLLSTTIESGIYGENTAMNLPPLVEHQRDLPNVSVENNPPLVIKNLEYFLTEDQLESSV